MPHHAGAIGALAVAFVLPAACAGGHGRTSGQVRIHDDLIEPAEWHVLVGSSVEWVDVGRNRHRVAADAGGFDPFDLAAGDHHVARFPRPGRFPYSVDHTLHGVIVADVTGAVEGRTTEPPESPESRESPDHPPGTRIVHYRATLTGTAHHLSTNDGPDKPVDDNTEEWTAIWDDAAFTIISSPSDTRIYAVDEFNGDVGEITATVDYHLVTANSRDNGNHIYARGADCADRMTQRTPVSMWLNVIDKPGDVNFDLSVAPSGRAGPDDPDFLKEHQRRCAGVGTAWTGRRVFSVDPGLSFEVTPETLSDKVYRQHSASVLPPVDSLLAHQPFEITTGERKEFDDHAHWSFRQWWTVTIRFQPR